MDILFKASKNFNVSKTCRLSPEFLLSLNSLQKHWYVFFIKRTGQSCNRVLANILEKHVMIVTLYRNTDLQYLMTLPARENLASLLIWSVNIAEEKINL